MESLRSKERALKISEIADDKKGQNISVLEVNELTPMADFFVIISGQNENQVQAIAREIENTLAEEGIEPHKIAGRNQGRWILLDYQDIIVHIFHHQEREYYDLERLWADAKKLLEDA